MPSATAGEEPILPAVEAVQSGEQVPPSVAQPTANAYNPPLLDPTYTTPSATAGDDMLAPMAAFQIGVHGAPAVPHPAENAEIFPSWEAT